MFRTLATLIVPVLLCSCASYSVTEGDIQNYLDKKTKIERAVGIKGIAYANIKFNDITVGIGRVSADRINLDAKSKAKVTIYNQPSQEIALNVNFSAIPYYDKEEGAIFLKNLEVEDIDIQPNNLNVPTKTLLSPIVEMVGQYLLTRPVYRLNEDDFKQAALKTARPELLIKNHTLVVQM